MKRKRTDPMTVNIIINDKQVDSFDVVKDQDDNLVRVEPVERLQYWDQHVESSDMYEKCLQWFGIELAWKQRRVCCEMLKTYPGRSVDEAVETVLTIYINRNNLKPKL